MATETENEIPCTPDTNNADAFGKAEPEQVNAQANENKISDLEQEFKRAEIGSPLMTLREDRLPQEICVRISNLVHLLYAKNCEKFPELAPKVQQEQPKAPAADGKPENVTRFNPKKDGRVCN